MTGIVSLAKIAKFTVNPKNGQGLQDHSKAQPGKIANFI